MLGIPGRPESDAGPSITLGGVEPLLIPWTTALGASPPVVAAGRDLLARWAEPHRRYHDRRHLAEVLAALQTLAGGEPVPVPVVCAAYAHDAVYAGAPDDEQRSADLAAEVLSGLGVPAQVVDEVVRLVLLTATHDVDPQDAAGALLSDADLAVLAAPEQRYRDYTRAVREEYSHLDDASFRRGRSAVLRSLLDRPRLYATQEGRRRWDAAARRNLQAEITSLGEASDDAARPPGGG